MCGTVTRPASNDDPRLKQMIALRDAIVSNPPRRTRVTQATERPISFNEEMVRALLAGRKTQTRRLAGADRPTGPCKFGAPGDLLWVRERWAPHRRNDRTFVYSADAKRPQRVTWRPSYHMPRQASRIVLEIIDVRVERVTDIREPDARAEGFDDSDRLWKDARGWFHQLWDRINTEPGTRWNDDPWVWVIAFRVRPLRHAGAQRRTRSGRRAARLSSVTARPA